MHNINDDLPPLTLEDVEEMLTIDQCACCQCVVNGEKIKKLHMELGDIDGQQVILAILCNRCKTIFESMMPFFDEELFVGIPEEMTIPILEYYAEYFKEQGMDIEESVIISMHYGGTKEEIVEDLNEFEQFLIDERFRLLNEEGDE